MMEAAITVGDVTRKATPEQKTDLFIADDRVTLIDIEADNIIKTLLQSNFPDIAILSEESEKKISSRTLHHMDDFTGFLVDPIDGSVNFSRTKSSKYGNYAVSIAYVETGIVQIGVIYKPLEDEMFHAIRGKGAFQHGNPIHVSEIDKLGHAAIELGSYWIREKPDLFIKWFTNKSIDVEQILIRGSAAAALADVGQGRLDAMLHSKLYPWDYAAGWVIVEEAGGIIMDGDCQPLKLGSRFIYATNKNLNNAVKTILMNS
jgi:myo-inositol-1(or 4)-monophosphatase